MFTAKAGERGEGHPLPPPQLGRLLNVTMVVFCVSESESSDFYSSISGTDESGSETESEESTWGQISRNNVGVECMGTRLRVQAFVTLT